MRIHCEIRRMHLARCPGTLDVMLKIVVPPGVGFGHDCAFGFAETDLPGHDRLFIRMPLPEVATRCFGACS